MPDTGGMSRGCDEALLRLSQAPILLVACDYDGTLAPIVGNPSDAIPNRDSVVALRALAEMQSTHVAVISGRSLHDLTCFLTGLSGAHLMGSHGSEFEPALHDQLPVGARDLLARIRQELGEIAETAHGLMVEHKPASVCLHTRNAAPEHARAAVSLVRLGPARLDGVFVKEGKEVLELGVIEMDKGRALEGIRRRLGATRCLFIGDDITDEDAFRKLHGGDVAIKVGEGPTVAALRLEDTDQVSKFLASLATARAKWLAGAASVPIQEHAMLSDQRTIALVTPRGRITWLCGPRIDSLALFADLLGGPMAGSWWVGPADGSAPLGQRYDDRSMCLVTSWKTLDLTDYLDCSGGRVRQRAGRTDLVRVVNGEGEVRVEFAPRLNFGRTPTVLRARPDGLEVLGALDPIVLRAPGVTWVIEEHGGHHSAIGHAHVREGEPLALELRYGTQSLRDAAPEAIRRKQTRRVWEEWVDSLVLPRQHADDVRRSALTLRALCHGPTGAIAAAGTTSLPESLGGVRNWDYRYCWPRDAAMAAAALLRLGSSEEAMHLLDWMRGVVERLPGADRLAPLYTVTGEQVGPEGEISELSGYAGSRPVRVGNAASMQVQLDVFGPIVDLVALLAEQGAPLSSWHWSLARSFAEAAALRWQEPDHGIWEPRIAPRHNVHTKVMCWFTIARARDAARVMLAEPPRDHDDLLDAIKSEVMEKGWSPQLRAFTWSYGSQGLDAAALWTGLSGMLDPSDDRFVSTVEAVERTLRRGATVYRYQHGDGLPGEEGGFNLCTSWLIESLALIGRRDAAIELFEQYRALAGSTGLMSEQHDPASGRALGNVPQAYSHLGLINAALRLSSDSA